MRTYGLFIGGEWVSTAERYEVRNPANGEVIAECAVAGEREVEQAIQAALQAFPDWAARFSEERARFWRAVARRLQERFEEFALVESQETGRTIRETMAHDIPASVSVFDYFAGIAPAIQGETIPVPCMYLNYTRREPYGWSRRHHADGTSLWLAVIKIALRWWQATRWC